MAADDYRANWRGARRYQFDEETRRKREAQFARQSREAVASADKTNLAPFRQIKHQEPDRLKVLAEDIAPPRRIEREEPEEPAVPEENIAPAPARPSAFLALVAVAVAASFVVTFFMV